jgi:hypothetical protein
MGRGLVVGTNRLFAAAEYLLKAGDALPRQTLSVGGSNRPGAPTMLELHEARAMLVRMGYLEARSSPKATRRQGS